jgi:tetratricopeptide (TPR) repeat protein
MVKDTVPARQRWPISDRSLPAIVGLLLLGLGAGASPFFFAYYDTSVWVPIGLVLVVACATGIVARPTRLAGPAALAVAGLLGLGIWSLVSIAWAESVEDAVVSGNRWLLYGALLLLILMLLRSERRSAVLLGATGLGVTAVALSVLVRLLGGDPSALFLNGRLNSPLGYINGEGCLFVMGLWLCLMAAEASRALVASVGAGMATLMACLALLTQSRGTALAMLGSLILVVALVPGRTRRLYGLLVVAAGVAFAAPDMLHVYGDTVGESVSASIAHAAGRAALLAAVTVGVVWGLLTASWRIVGSDRRLENRIRTLGSWMLVVPAVLALAVAVGSADRIEHEVRDQWRAFTHLAGSSSAATSSGNRSRLLSGAGNRYDYWRIAWKVWKEHPLLGVGAGNYPRSYYELRTTDEDIEQPHSIELQALSELGVAGALLLVVFVVGVGWGIVRMRRRARQASLPRALMAGGLGTFVAWLTQTSVDWMHLLPGLTGIALIAAAVLIWPQDRLGGARQRGLAKALTARPARALGLSAMLATLVLAGASLGRQGLADLYRSRAQTQLDAHPASALTDADRSLDIDPDAVETYYIKASIFAHFDQAAAADSTLGEALAHEPNNFVTWALLGDIAMRERRFTLAKHDYARAHQLNPKDLALAEPVAGPSSSRR